MQPSDTTPAPQPPKQGFWAKLFGKKPATPPVIIPPAESHTPEPQLGESTPDATPVADISVAAQPNVDSITGAPQAPAVSSPNENGDVTSLPLDVPASVSAAEATANTGGENPTLAVQPPAAEVPPVVSGLETPVSPTGDNEPTPPANPSQPQ